MHDIRDEQGAVLVHIIAVKCELINLGYQTQAAVFTRNGCDETLSFRNADV